MADLKELADEAAKELLKAIRDQARKASDLKLLQLAQVNRPGSAANAVNFAGG
jgi:hypothetical protein